MARRENELFIGADKLTLEGRYLKHPALISYYANVNINKTTDAPIDPIGIDIETNHLTGEMKLLGLWDGEKYTYYTDNFISVIYSLLRDCSWSGKSLVYWNKLDPFVIFKQFLLLLTDEGQERAINRWGKIGGVWDREAGVWKVAPIVSVRIGGRHFGIKNVIRSSIQFFMYNEADPYLNTIWAYDIAQLYQNGLESEMLRRRDLFPYYSKVDKSAHLVDWDRFETNHLYRNEIVLRSNELDARAVYDLALHIQEMFYDAFGHYARTLVSTGSLARASIVAVLHNKYAEEFPEQPKKAARLVADDIKSIGFINYYDRWAEMLGGDHLKNLYCLVMEAYSGGYIEAIRYGYADTAYYADIASAYPAIIAQLYDLRGSKITAGTGEPPRKPHSYVFIRGKVYVPLHINYNPITVKHPYKPLNSTNIRASGDYRASYTIEERDYMIEQGAEFSDEEWYCVETEGKPSPLADIVKYFLDLRTKLLAEGSSAQYVAKISANSLYGILFEAVDTYEEDIHGVYKAGYRAGEFFNPLYASIITARTRIQIAKAAQVIEHNGGKPILLMTDSVFWMGKKSALPDDMWREKKTLGFLEKPETIHDLVSLGAGRYSYLTAYKDIVISKNRGMNVVEFDDDGTAQQGVFNWLDGLAIAARTKSTSITAKVRKLVSVGTLKTDSKYTVKDIGRVVEETMNIDILTGLTKRILDEELDDPADLSKRMINTRTIVLSANMYGDGNEVDQTLPTLRAEIMKMTVHTSEQKDKKNRRKATAKHLRVNKIDINATLKKKYNALKKYGYNAAERKKMAQWSNEKILDKLIKDGKAVKPNENEDAAQTSTSN